MIAIPAWLIISMVLLAILILLFRTANQVFILSLIKNNFFYFFAMALFIFLAISLINIHSNYDTDFTTFEGLKGVVRIYASWAYQVFTNLGKITGYTIQQNWFSGNTTGG